MPVDLLPDLDYHALGQELSIPGLDSVDSGSSEINVSDEQVTSDELQEKLDLIEQLRDHRAKRNKSGVNVREIVQEYNENPVALISEIESSSMLKVALHLLATEQQRQGQTVQKLWVESSIGSVLPSDIDKERLPISMEVNGNILQCFKISGIHVITYNSHVVYATLGSPAINKIAQMFANIVKHS